MNNRALTLPAAAALAALALSACAGPADTEQTDSPASTSLTTGTTAPNDSAAESSTAPPSEPSTPEEPAGPTLAVTISGSDVGPNAEELTVAPGETITITFDTDRGGELHVHSKPEQFVEFDAGTSTEELVIDTPGTVEIEEHDSEAVVAVVEVK